MSTQQISMLPHFDGRTYEPARDHARLSEQLKEVRYFLLLGGWHTVSEIQAHLLKVLGKKYGEAGIQSRCRDLRKAKFGGYKVESRRVSDGLWQYRIKE